MSKNAVFSCFNNFVPGDEYGTPSFRPMYKALQHLRTLVLCCLDHVKALRINEVYMKAKNSQNLSYNL